MPFGFALWRSRATHMYSFPFISDRQLLGLYRAWAHVRSREWIQLRQRGGGGTWISAAVVVETFGILDCASMICFSKEHSIAGFGFESGRHNLSAYIATFNTFGKMTFKICWRAKQCRGSEGLIDTTAGGERETRTWNWIVTLLILQMRKDIRAFFGDFDHGDREQTRWERSAILVPRQKGHLMYANNHTFGFETLSAEGGIIETRRGSVGS